MSCPFYGKNGMFGRLLDQGGNECALILTNYSPCAMEVRGETPDERTCPIVMRARQIHNLIELARPEPARMTEAPEAHQPSSAERTTHE